MALEAVCQADFTASQLSESLRVKKSFVSRIAKSLAEKGLVQVEKQGNNKLIKLSMASHAQNFKKLFESRPNAKIDNWLSGNAIDVLILASFAEGIMLKALFEEANCSKPSVYKTLKQLYSAGVAAKYGSKIVVTDSLVRAFANSYADNIQLIMQKQVKGINASIRVRKHVVLRTDSKTTPQIFSQTGISALAKRGLEAVLTSYKDYYFNLNEEKKEISVEEAFVHALLLSTIRQHQDQVLLEMFFAKNINKLSLRLLRKLALDYAVEGKMDEVRRVADSLNKIKAME
ncbi:winged helix-turn-helix transcriptional regulator [Candidatus Micrarchaeota archaeon]|nr:winged helix-turn-helix transcriptional regulator [Candidatus Micrarchaeota archaeon]